MDTVLWLPTETLKWLSSLPILMQESFWWWQCSDRYIYDLPLPPPPYPLPLFSPSLISLMVSVDVKHSVYLLTYFYLSQLVGKGHNALIVLIVSVTVLIGACVFSCHRPVFSGILTGNLLCRCSAPVHHLMRWVHKSLNQQLKSNLVLFSRLVRSQFLLACPVRSGAQARLGGRWAGLSRRS